MTAPQLLAEKLQRLLVGRFSDPSRSKLGGHEDQSALALKSCGKKTMQSRREAKVMLKRSEVAEADVKTRRKWR